MFIAFIDLRKAFENINRLSVIVNIRKDGSSTKIPDNIETAA